MEVKFLNEWTIVKGKIIGPIRSKIRTKVIHSVQNYVYIVHFSNEYFTMVTVITELSYFLFVVSTNLRLSYSQLYEAVYFSLTKEESEILNETNFPTQVFESD